MCRILWIDNHADELEDHAEVLRNEGVQVELDASADHALERLKTGDKFDLLIIDLRLKEGADAFILEDDKSITSGIELINKLRENKVRVPVCILSSYLQLEEYQDALKELDIPGVALDKYVDPLTGAWTSEVYWRFVSWWLPVAVPVSLLALACLFLNRPSDRS